MHYKGTGKIVSADFKNVVWTGRTKGGQEVKITVKQAINMGNLDWAFAEKDDTVAEAVFEGTYDNTDGMALSDADLIEPWDVEYTAGTGEAGTILLGAGKLSIGGNDVALTRGGGQFTVEREIREINADGDRGAVKDRVEMVSARPRLTVRALTMLNRLADLYPAITTATTA